MKKIIFSLLLAVTMFSCTTEEHYDVTTFTETYTVKPNDWHLSDDRTYFYYQFREPALTYDIYDRGMLAGFYLYNVANSEAIAPLPYDIFYIDNQGNPFYTQQVSCEFKPGYVTFILQYDDQADALPNFNCKFMVKMML